MENGQVRLPRTDRVTILLCHHASDLCEMSEIMRHPSCQELLQRHNAERGILSGELELCGRQTQSAQFAKILLSQLTELREQVTERAILVEADVTEALECLETTFGPWLRMICSRGTQFVSSPSIR